MGDDQDDGFTGWLKIKIQNDKIERLEKELLEAQEEAKSAQRFAKYQSEWPDRFIKYMGNWFLFVFVWGSLVCIIWFLFENFVLYYIVKFIRYLF